LPTFLITGLTVEELSVSANEHIDVLFVVGEYVIFRVVDVEDVLVVTVELQDVVELASAVWHELI
jgi:hypothetical protein